MKIRAKTFSGQALVELALILPFLVMLFIGIVDCARAFHCWSTINHMCIEGARTASQRKNFRVIPNYFGPETHNTMDATWKAFYRYISPLTASEAINVTFTGIGQATDTVTISCTYRFRPWFPGISALIGNSGDGTITLHGRAVQRKE
ncbi:MAG TPA: TadE family protein [Candidatus Ozemobacteraceae bacterium]